MKTMKEWVGMRASTMLPIPPVMVWHSLMIYTSWLDWGRASSVTVARERDIKIEGIVIMKEVKSQSDMTVSIKVESVPMNDIGQPDNLWESNLSVQGFLQLVGECEVCIVKGVPNPTHLSCVWCDHGQQSRP